MENETAPVRKGRGKGKKPALACTSIRLSRGTIDFFKAQFKDNAQKQMREVLEQYKQNFHKPEGELNDVQH